MARWLEPCIDYGPGCTRATPLEDAAIALKHRAYELLSRKGAHELEVRRRVDCVSRVLPRIHRFLTDTNFHANLKHAIESWEAQYCFLFLCCALPTDQNALFRMSHRVVVFKPCVASDASEVCPFSLPLWRSEIDRAQEGDIGAIASTLSSAAGSLEQLDEVFAVKPVFHPGSLCSICSEQ